MKKFAVIVLALILALGCTSAFATTKIRVGASPAPHAEILEVAKNILEPLLTYSASPGIMSINPKEISNPDSGRRSRNEVRSIHD